MIKIALTGNIASGKSIILDLLKNDGIKTICLDEVTHEIYKSEKLKSKLIEIFKTDIRSEISKIVFSDSKKLEELNSIFKPLLKEELENFFIKNNNEKYTVTAAPILFETGFEKYFDKIIFVSSKKELRTERLKLRNNLTEKEAIDRINSQESEEEKIKKSDYIICNNSTLDDLKASYIKLKEYINTL